MANAAATITAQLGDMLASHTPKGDVQAPPNPMATPSLGRHVLLRTCVTTPEMDVGMIVNNDVAVEAMALMPKASRYMGTMTVPPPTPSKPENTPMSNPSRIAAMSVIIMGSF